jgi:hypothetical protein
MLTITPATTMPTVAIELCARGLIVMTQQNIMDESALPDTFAAREKAGTDR